MIGPPVTHQDDLHEQLPENTNAHLKRIGSSRFQARQTFAKRQREAPADSRGLTLLVERLLLFEKFLLEHGVLDGLWRFFT